MELMIFRHAKSSWADLSLADYDRPLKGRGKRDAVAMGRFIRDRNLIPDHVLSSPANRAAQTIKRAINEWAGDPDTIQWSQDLYHAGVQAWLKALAQCPPKARRVMIVGHNPGLEELLEFLCGPEVEIPVDGKLLPTAALAQIEFKVPWTDLEAGSGKLKRITRARWLSEGGKQAEEATR